MQKKNHGSILIISHQERILNIADQIVVLANGQVSKIGTKDEILPELMATTAISKTCDKFEEGGM